MAEVKVIARVILRSDGFVHIAFEDIRSIYATPANIIEFFSDPMEFIEVGSHHYEASTFDINRNRVALSEVLGLTLAYVTSDKQVVCNFPELYQSVFSDTLTSEQKYAHLSMKEYENSTILADEKAFLLQYYLQLTGHLKKMPVIKKNLKLRDMVQFEIVREILNAFLVDELPKAAKTKDLSAQIKLAESEQVFQAEPDPESNFISASEYARQIGVSLQTVRKYISKGQLRNVKKNSRGWLFVDKNEVLEPWDRRKGRKKSVKDHRKKAGSAADVAEHILKHNLFSAAVAEYIHTFEELDYYTQKEYHEFLWDGRPVLAIDVNPDYIHSKTGKSNRELMQEGKAPVYPSREKEDFVFHVHHLARRKDCFAIIPEYDHIGKPYTNYFHSGGASEEDLHGPEFEAQKASMWRTYLEEYDKAGKFSLIPYLNSRRNRYKKK